MRYVTSYGWLIFVPIGIYVSFQSQNSEVRILGLVVAAAAVAITVLGALDRRKRRRDPDGEKDLG